MAETRILPVRSINSSACRGTLRLSCVQGGTRLEPMLQCRKAGSVTLYAMLRRGRVMRADADGAGYFVAANDVAGAIILMDGTIAGAAFYGISAAARERAFTAVRMEEARRQGIYLMPTSEAQRLAKLLFKPTGLMGKNVKEKV